MSTGKLTTVVIAIVACVSLGTLVQQSRANRAMHDEWLTANSAVEAGRAAVRALAQRATEEEKQVGALQEQIVATKSRQAAAARAAESGAAGVPGESATPPNPVDAGYAFLAAHPGVKNALVQRSRARVAARFQPMYAKVGFSPEQIEKFETLMIENEGITMGDEKDTLVLRPGTGMSRAEVDAALHAMLGEAGYEVYRQTAAVSPYKSVTTMLAANLYFTDSPLTAPQADQLAQMLSEMKGAHASDTFIERAATILSPPQMEALRGLKVEEDFNRAMSEGAKRWMADFVNAADAARKAGGK